MQSNIITVILIFITISFTFQPLMGQEKVSEAEVHIQEAFIEAKKQQLLGNLDKAIELFEEIWKDHSDIHALAYEIAKVYLEKEEMNKAQEYAEKALALDAENIWYMTYLADIYVEMGQNLDAASVYEKITKITPEDREIYNKWAFQLTKAEKINEAIDVYDKVEARFGIDEEIIRQKYTLYLGSGKDKKAEKELLKLTESSPNETVYLEMLAGFYEQINQEGKAKEVYQRILNLDADNATAKMALAGQSSAVSDEIRFLESLEDVFANEEVELKLKIERIQPLISKAYNEKDASLANKILDLTTGLEETHSSEAPAFAISAQMLLALDRGKEAEGKLKQALELDDTKFYIWEQLLALQWANKDYEALSNSSLDAMDVFPNEPLCYYYNGMSLIKVEDYGGALSILDQALLMSESNKELLQKIHVGMALAYGKENDHIQALSSFEEALKPNPENPLVLTEYAYYMALRKQDLDKAVTLAEKAVKVDPSNGYPLRSLAWVYYQKNDFKQAQKQMESALEKGLSEEPNVLEQYGDILFKLGQENEAVQYWHKAKQKGSSSKLLDKKISEKRLF